MRTEKKNKKAKEASDKAIAASVTKEMAKPRIAQSAQAEADEQRKVRYGKPARHHAVGAAKAHIK